MFSTDSSSDNKKILLTTRNVRLDSGRYAPKYYIWQNSLFVPVFDHSSNTPSNLRTFQLMLIANYKILHILLFIVSALILKVSLVRAISAESQKLDYVSFPGGGVQRAD
jgi:hypothetical protein